MASPLPRQPPIHSFQIEVFRIIAIAEPLQKLFLLLGLLRGSQRLQYAHVSQGVFVLRSCLQKATSLKIVEGRRDGGLADVLPKVLVGTNVTHRVPTGIAKTHQGRDIG